jgi:DNA-binding NarL/FixJ family response regulator
VATNALDRWPYGPTGDIADAATALASALDQLDPLAALSQIRAIGHAATNAATELVLIASRAGYTNRRIADALGVSPSTLRGLKEEARRAT